jgi:hypothetical protein
MKVFALALALCFSAASVQAATKTPVTKSHKAFKKNSKIKTRTHVKRANKAGHLKKLNRARAAKAN